MSDKPATLQPALRGDRLLRLVATPPEGMHWTCAKCGGGHFGEPPANGTCAGCHHPWRDRRPESREDALRSAGVPRRHLRPFVEPGPDGLQRDWPRSRDGAAATSWPDASGWCLVLTGETGCGKSAIAAELLWRAMRKRGTGGLWLRAEAVANQVLSGKADSLLDTASSPLVLDELGIGHESQAAWSAVESLICRQWEQEAPTIITTNLAASALLAKSAPLADRLRDGITCRVEGKSLRGSR